MTYEQRDDRPRTIPEMRGLPAIDRDRDHPFSAKSYAAQYGITVEDAEDILQRCNSHGQVHRQIVAMFKNDAVLKRRALMLDDERNMTGEEKKTAAALLKRLGLASLPRESGA
jgi:predicted HNH restriction endonuclease